MWIILWGYFTIFQQTLKSYSILKKLCIKEFNIIENRDDKYHFMLILAPGFSTAKKVTSVSGRGVGMDVVQQALNALRASIRGDDS